MRSKRPTAARLSHLETKHDKLELVVAGMNGKVDAIHGMAARAEAAREEREQRDAVERASKRAQVVPVIKALGVALALIAAAVVGHGV